MRRDDICLYLAPNDRAQLQARLADRNSARKLVWRAGIVLAAADGCGLSAIMRRADPSKPTVWRWQARYLDEGVDGLRRDKTHPSRVRPLPRETRLKVITRTVQATPANASHWHRSAMAAAFGILPSGVGRIWAGKADQKSILHLVEIARTVAPSAHVVVIMDQAGWHRTDALVIPETISIIPLPAQCPERWSGRKHLAVHAG